MSVLRSVSEATIDTEYKAFIDQMNAQAVAPANDDPVTAAQCEAGVEVHNSNPAVELQTKRWLAAEVVEHPVYRVRKWSRAVQYLLSRDEVRYDLGYPGSKFTDPAPTLEYLSETVGQPTHPDHTTFSQILSDRPLQTSRRRRASAIGFVLGMQHLREAFKESGAKPVVHDFGAADNIVLKAVSQPRRADRMVQIVDHNNEPSGDLSSFFHLVTRMAPFGRGYGVDKKPPRTQMDRDYLKACALDPSQMASDISVGVEEEAYDLLARSNPDNIKTIQGDFLQLNEKKQARLLRDKADVGFLSHVLPPSSQSYGDMIRAVLPFIKRGGLIALHGYVQVESDANVMASDLDDWYGQKWQCQTLVYNTLRPHDGLIPILQFQDSTCERGRLLEGVGKFLPEVNDLITQ